MKIAVTGATGFVGLHLVRALVDAGHNVVGLGRDTVRGERVARMGGQVLLGNLEDPAFVHEAFAGVDAVIHVAALSAPWGSKLAFQQANVAGTQNVVDACQARGVGRLIHISSPSVTFCGQDVKLQTEKSKYPARYLCYYSETKRVAELIVQDAMQHGCAATVLRPKAIFGPGDTTLVPRLLKMAREGRLAQIGPGRNLIDLTYVTNVVQSIQLCLNASATIGKTYVVTNAEHVNLWDVVRRIAREVAGVTELRQVSFAVAYAFASAAEAAARVAHWEPRLTRYSVALLAREQTYDISSFVRDTNYVPEVSVEEGLRRTMADQRELLRGAHAR